jgi:hypothetical protein
LPLRLFLLGAQQVGSVEACARALTNRQRVTKLCRRALIHSPSRLLRPPPPPRHSATPAPQADTGGTIGSRPELATAAAAFAEYYLLCRPQLPAGRSAVGAPAKAAAAGQAAPRLDDRRSLSLDSRSRGHGGVAVGVVRAGSCTESSSWDLEVCSAPSSSEDGGGSKGAAAARAMAALGGCRGGGGGGKAQLGAGWRATVRCGSRTDDPMPLQLASSRCIG